MLTLNANFNRKVPGSEQYSSAGYSCSITAEVDDSYLHDPAALQDKLKYLYAQCEDAVEKQINGASKPKDTTPETKSAGNNRVKDGQYTNRVSGNTKTAGGRNNVNTGRRSTAQSEQRQDSAQAMTDKQRSFIEKLAVEADLDLDRLNAITGQMFNSSFDSLSKLDASSLVSTLKDIKEGVLQVTDL